MLTLAIEVSHVVKMQNLGSISARNQHTATGALGTELLETLLDIRHIDSCVEKRGVRKLEIQGVSGTIRGRNGDGCEILARYSSFREEIGHLGWRNVPKR